MNKLSSFKGLILVLIGLIWIVSCSQNEKEIKVITFETTLGPIVIELFEEEAPITSKNFLEYAESGFYNGTLFHRVIPGFVIQGGGMESGMVNKEGNPPIMNEGNNGIKIFIDKEHRIFNEEIYLFDHPEFGILFSINKI